MELHETVETFYAVYDWMNFLGLTLAQREVYAVIFGFTVNGTKSFRGSQNYIAKRTLTTRITVNRAVKVLKEKGLIRVRSFRVGNEIYYDYMAVECNLVREAKEKDRQSKLRKNEIFDTELLNDDTAPCKLETQPLYQNVTPPCNTELHNNKANNKFKNKAASCDKQVCHEEAGEQASPFKNKILEMFKIKTYPFDSAYEETLRKTLTESGVGEDKTEAFLEFVMNRMRANTNCSSPAGLFRKLSLAPDVAADFIQTYKPPRQAPKEVCPCCGKMTVIGHEFCDNCGLDSIYFKDSLEVYRYKEKMKLEPKVREKLEDEIFKAIMDGGFMRFDPEIQRIRREKINKIYVKYGIIYENQAVARISQEI